jgi:cysteine desulfurase
MMARDKLRVYFDHNATTYMRQEVVDAMMPFMRERFGNASSLHFFGQENRGVTDRARRQVAEFIGAEQEEVIFTSGGTESDNIAIRGVIAACRKKVARPHIVTSSIEHPAVLTTCRTLEGEGIDVTYLPCTGGGVVDLENLERALERETALVSIMFSNNETGVIQPLEEASRLVKNAGAVFHVDAVQGMGKIDVDVNRIGADLLSISAHKFYGPKGVGALYVRRGTSVEPIYTGGHQELSLRPGTENIPGIVGFGEACEISMRDLPDEMDRIGGLRDRLQEGIMEHISNVRINGSGVPRVPNTCNVTVPGIEGDAMALNLSMLGFALSSGSACATGDSEPSYVLRAMGLDPVEAQGALRISLGICNTDDDVDAFLEIFPGVVKRLRDMSPI